MNRNDRPDAVEHTSRMIADKHLDDAIDRAVRQMTNVEPARGLDRRILSRLDAQQYRRIFTWPRLVTGGLVAAAVIGLVIANTRPAIRTSPDVTARAVPTTPAPRVDDSPQADVHSTAAPQRTERVAPAPRRITNVVRAASVADLEPAVTVPPLETIVPIEVAPVEAETLGMSQIAIEPIRVRPLRVEPLSSTPQ